MAPRCHGSYLNVGATWKLRGTVHLTRICLGTNSTKSCIRETTWPKHRFDAIIDTALENLGRSDLRLEVVCVANMKEFLEQPELVPAQEWYDAALRDLASNPEWDAVDRLFARVPHL